MQQPIQNNKDSQSLVPRLIEDHATTRPNSIAVISRGRTLTFKELNDRAAALANRLRSSGVSRDIPVGLCMKSSPAMLIGALGILKAGGAYLPLDPAYPVQRLHHILNDADIPVLVKALGATDPIPRGRWKTIELDEEGLFTGHQADASPAGERKSIRSEDLAYVIYTSGSTGQPKGVEISHGSLLHLVNWHQSAFSVASDDRASQLAGVGFDAAVWETWPYLAAGASVHIADESARADPEKLRDWILSERITISFVPTAMAERVIKLEWPRETSLRMLLTGADTLHRFPPAELPFPLINNYGPTECTVVATSGLVPANENSNESPSIGWPIANTHVYLLDEQLRQAPAGSSGELYIAGPGLARGYVNRPDLTAEKFVPNPFTEEPGARMYRTGDRGRYLPDGQIAFLGRIDDQIKIRGFRIEPNEIVAALNQCPDIQESAVVARETATGEVGLVAYFAASHDSEPTVAGLQGFLRSRLPDYMVPPIFVQLERLPLTANGKVDSTALPEPTSEIILTDRSFEAPRSPVEERVADLLTELLQVDRIGLSDNFFHLGGHSLLGAQVIARVRETFGVELSLRGLFDHPTVEGISGEIERLILAKLEDMGDDAARRILAYEGNAAD